ncbi:tripartite tricarboxylate transporter TctB family protein [Pseudorhodoplanes sp.]|uniref:tripartite tricarboxylate transporter TctB family protein n=1 Tax=Pseudorhodoplanes sp. TaxID=1934341 RepID=UPI00391D7545
MLSRDYRDIMAGLVMIAIGGGAAIYAWAFYRLGTVMHMGPGMFPFGLGILLAIIGVIVVLPALMREAPPIPRPDIRSFIFVSLSLVAFALTVRWIGLVPAVVLLVVIAALADNKLGLVKSLALAALLSVLAWFIFIYALGIPLQPFIWAR